MKKGGIFIILFFILFLAVAGYGYYLFLEQAKTVKTLQERIRALDSAQSYTQRLLDSTKEQLNDIQLNLGSLKEQANTFGEKLSNLDERITLGEKTSADISSKLIDLSSKIGSLEDAVNLLKSREKVDLGNISVEKK